MLREDSIHIYIGISNISTMHPTVKREYLHVVVLSWTRMEFINELLFEKSGRNIVVWTATKLNARGDHCNV